MWQLLTESGNAFWVEAPTLNWTKASNLGLVRSHHIAACESLLETYFMQVAQHERVPVLLPLAYFGTCHKVSYNCTTQTWQMLLRACMLHL